jgi:hypothetical protein
MKPTPSANSTVPLSPVVVPRYHDIGMSDCVVSPSALEFLTNHIASCPPLPIMGTSYANASVFCSVCNVAAHAPSQVVLCQHCYKPACLGDTTLLAGTSLDDDTHYPLVNVPAQLARRIHIFPMRIAACIRCVAERSWCRNSMYTHPRLLSPSVSACLRQWQDAHLKSVEAERVAFYETLNAYANTQKANAALQDRIDQLEKQVQRLQQQAATTPPPSPPSFESFVDMYNRAFCQYNKPHQGDIDAIHGRGLFPGPGSSPLHTPGATVSF